MITCTITIVRNETHQTTSMSKHTEDKTKTFIKWCNDERWIIKEKQWTENTWILCTSPRLKQLRSIRKEITLWKHNQSTVNYWNIMRISKHWKAYAKKQIPYKVKSLHRGNFKLSTISTCLGLVGKNHIIILVVLCVSTIHNIWQYHQVYIQFCEVS